MLNKNKRFLVKFPVLLAIAVIGSNAIQALSIFFFINGYVSLNWLRDNMNIAVDMNRAQVELGWWAMFVAVWLVIVHLAVLWFVSGKMEARLWKRWPDGDFRKKIAVIKVRQTKKKGL